VARDPNSYPVPAVYRLRRQSAQWLLDSSASRRFTAVAGSTWAPPQPLVSTWQPPRSTLRSSSHRHGSASGNPQALRRHARKVVQV